MRDKLALGAREFTEIRTNGDIAGGSECCAGLEVVHHTALFSRSRAQHLNIQTGAGGQ